ncbi:hypothetical protein KL921_005426 [Ogataea angusta]|nr:hypothetical protein KL921_005426 [Ogataea angusta]
MAGFIDDSSIPRSTIKAASSLIPKMAEVLNADLSMYRPEPEAKESLFQYCNLSIHLLCHSQFHGKVYISCDLNVVTIRTCDGGYDLMCVQLMGESAHLSRGHCHVFLRTHDWW